MILIYFSISALRPQMSRGGRISSATSVLGRVASGRSVAPLRRQDNLDTRVMLGPSEQEGLDLWPSNQGQSQQSQQQHQQQGRSIARASATDLAVPMSATDRPLEDASPFVERGMYSTLEVLNYFFKNFATKGFVFNLKSS